jgi:ADP-ribosyl-[dinitrogen reductase] hydrolase
MDVGVARERIRGSLLAGAVGDALGAPVEFLRLEEIRARLGPAGVTGFLPAYGRDGGAITDDTQMTLFTADGVIRALVRFTHKGIAHPPSVVRRSYWRWLTTQGEPWPANALAFGTDDGWLIGVDGLRARRAPGNTCLSALRGGQEGSIEHPLNDSKGCGGVMRVAPAGFICARDPLGLAAECAALTHGHPSGYLAAGFLGLLLARLLQEAPLGEALDDASEELRGHDGHEEALHAVTAARGLATRGVPSAERVESLGAGWVADEALAIAVYCALAVPDVRAGLLLAVNHSGDSDSTGAITGNILGAIHGERAIPADLLEPLELREVIASVADDLADAFHGEGAGGERWPVSYPGA